MSQRGTQQRPLRRLFSLPPVLSKHIPPPNKPSSRPHLRLIEALFRVPLGGPPDPGSRPTSVELPSAGAPSAAGRRRRLLQRHVDSLGLFLPSPLVHAWQLLGQLPKESLDIQTRLGTARHQTRGSTAMRGGACQRGRGAERRVLKLEKKTPPPQGELHRHRLLLSTILCRNRLSFLPGLQIFQSLGRRDGSSEPGVKEEIHTWSRHTRCQTLMLSPPPPPSTPSSSPPSLSCSPRGRE